MVRLLPEYELLKNGKWNIIIETKREPTDRKTKNMMAG
jgi:hypothetical protein